MAYCRNCGKQIDAKAAICPNCGVPQQTAYATPPPYQPPYQPQIVDDGNIGWAFLGFFVPIVGLILYLVWKDTKPRTAKTAGKGALISFIAYFALFVIIFTIYLFVMFMALFSYSISFM